MSDKDFIATIIKAREDAVNFFSSARKPERERWVVEEFLGNLGVDVRVGNISSPKDEPPDVNFLNARFEIKEILEPGRRRHAEYKESLRRAREAETVEDLFEIGYPQDIKYTEICTLVKKAIPNIRQYAPAIQKKLDLLFYVNIDRSYASGEMVDERLSHGHGWRSISFISGPLAVVLFADEDAPSFLQSNVGKINRRKSS